ncbi:MAG: magnesium transporter [Candidatus Marinimicrobia bacterium]|nr:magnesium transporter [Candidatus Neomarinimicrobiota bacterium]RKY59035.1 MAG: magnesium transporter [Candidatus Neomarinimicrobiota bacterium]
MIDREFIILQDAFRRLIRRNASSNTQKMIMKTHPADLAALFRSFTAAEREKIFKLISDRAYKAEFLTELDRSILVDIVKDMPPKDIAELLNEMAPDDQADIVAQIPEDLGKEVLGLLSASDSEDLEELMMYEPDTAGGIMVPLPFKMNENDTVQEAIDAIREQKDAEMVFYIYVVDENNKLTGVISLRQLLMTSPKTVLQNIMITKVVSVHHDTDQEEVARIISRYNFLAIPVVDKDNTLMGIVTVDDIIDVIREEATEDFLQMAGVGKDREILLKSPLEAARIRFPWLFATFIGGLIVSSIVVGFHELLSKFVILAAFMPIIAGMGGNVGAQSSTIIVRGLVTGRINFQQLFKVLFRQLLVGLILGFAFGVLLSALSNIFYHTTNSILTIGGIIGISMCCELTIAATIGTVVPMLLQRINVDPAVATSPIVQTTMDITGMLVYFSIASSLLM